MVHPRLQTAVRSPLLAASARRHAVKPTRASSTLALHVADYSVTTSPEDTFRDSRIAGLRHALLKAGSPSRVWAHYTNLVNYFNTDALPLELHQQVLRQCSPPAPTLRISAAKSLLDGRKPENPHLYEGRFQTIISNIRALGRTPSLEDYHFILEQFAAVGHHIGSLQVYQEILNLSLTPEPKTFGLCLQSIAHRLTLPVGRTYRPRLLAQTRKALDDLMADMRKYHVPFTQANLDLALRIFKETVDKEGFATLVKWTYGIDLSNPDCPPLELSEAKTPPTLLPLTTHALNTIIDTLGRFKDVSKLVQAFEVLTQPLPQAKQHQFSSFDDEDDFGVSVDVSSPSAYSSPSAIPNTTTFNMLLFHLGQAEHAVLSRHYLIQAMRLDREVHMKLFNQIYVDRLPLDHIPAPHFSLNRRMLLSVFGHSNRYKNLGLMRWLSTKMERILRVKRKDLELFTSLREKLGKPSHASIDGDAVAEISEMVTSSPSHDFEALLPLMMKTRTKEAVDVRKIGTAFKVDVNDQRVPDTPTERMFDLDLHIRVLERDFKELQEFAKVLDEVLGRTTQRTKEKLGRRVWREKDIYLAIDNARKLISRGRWNEIVNFRARRNPGTRPPRNQRRGSPPIMKDVPPHQRDQGTSSETRDDPPHHSRPSVMSRVASKARAYLPS